MDEAAEFPVAPLKYADNGNLNQLPGGEKDALLAPCSENFWSEEVRSASCHEIRQDFSLVALGNTG